MAFILKTDSTPVKQNTPQQEVTFYMITDLQFKMKGKKRQWIP